MFWILVCAGLALCLYFSLVKPFEYWNKKGIKSYRFWTVWKETILGVMKSRPPAETITKVYKDFPGARYVGGYQLYYPVLCVKDPDLIKQITVKDFDHFVDHTQFLAEDVEPLFNNLFFLKGEKWRDVRSILSPAFTGSKMKMMFGDISASAKQFVQYFQEQNSETVIVEMKDACLRFTNDVIASTAFGLSCNSLRDRSNEFFLMGIKAISGDGTYWETIKTLFFLICPRFIKALGIKLANEDVRNFFKTAIKDNMQTRERDEIVRPDMLHLLMEAQKDTSRTEKYSAEDVEKRQKGQISDDDITAQAMNFFFAGFNVVATAMCFLTYELAVNPDIQQKLQNEIDDTLNHCKGSLTYEALSKMKYMEMVISESLRKWPSVLGLDRMCVKPYTIQPVKNEERLLHIKKGIIVFVPTFGMHWDPQFFPEPERFDPERFSDENKSNINPYTYMPFGAGPRNCIGTRFSLLEIKLLIFHILTTFDITVVEKTPVPLILSRKQLLHPEGGMWLGLKRRDGL